MNRHAQLIYIVSAMILAAPQAAEAATTIRTTTSSFSLSGSSSGTITFADVISADQLVSISGGSVSGGEGGSLAIAVNYSGGSASTIFAQTFAQSGQFTYNLTSVPTSSFASGTITGLTFMLTSRIGIGPNLSIPIGTNFTFRVPDAITPAVPEPATWAMMLVGFGALGASLRWRRVKRRSLVS